MKIFTITEVQDCLSSKFPDNKIELIPINFKHNINQALNECIKTSINMQLKYSIICLNKQLISKISEYWLIENLEKSFKLKCKLLLFNANNIKTLVPICDSFFWVDFFKNTYLFAIHESIYEDLLIELQNDECAFTEILSNVTSNKLLIHPMLLTNKEDSDQLLLTHRMNRMMSKLKFFQKQH